MSSSSCSNAAPADTAARPRMAALAAYGLLGLPLAMVALPVYMQLPAWYVHDVGLGAATTGFVLFGARLLDTVQDPWLGRLVDVLARRGWLGAALRGAALLLALAFAGLWRAPPAGAPWQAVAWLAGMLALTYGAHSLLNIALLAWGARLAPDARGRTRAAAWREASGLAGVLIASVLPAGLRAIEAPAVAMDLYAVIFALLLFLGVELLLRRAPRWHAAAAPAAGGGALALAPAVRRLMLPYAVNALAVALPATLALFFIDDQLGAHDWTAAFLASYFLAGAAGTPLWVRLAARIGAARAWAAAMVLALLTFTGAAWLGPGDGAAFELVCLLSGLALGADLVLPPVLLAAAIGPQRDPGLPFGVWTLLGKLATALSALALPALQWAGYQPGLRTGSSGLVLAYAALPCLLKLLALALLFFRVIAREETV